jgi:hypothetical protein
MLFRSKPENAALDVDAFAALDDEWEYTAIPVLDKSEELTDGIHICFQGTHKGGSEALKLLGLEMLTPDDLERLHQLATEGRCLELPAFTGTPTAETSLAARRISDAANRAAMVRLGWQPGSPVCNFGKVWVEGKGRPVDRAWLMGWWVPRVESYGIVSRHGAGFVQPRPTDGRGPHGVDDQADDGTNLVGKRRRQPAARDVVPKAVPRELSEKPSLGLRALEIARQQLLLNVREVAGPKANAQISAYLDLCRRTGGPRAGMPASDADVGLDLFGPKTSDEIAWCAAGASWCCRQVAGVDEAPHGYRAAVHELVSDARKLGTWRALASGYVAQPGDLAISARAGGDPTKGGTGHVERVESVGPHEVVTIGGNENNTWLRGPLSLIDPNLRGWITY